MFEVATGIDEAAEKNVCVHLYPSLLLARTQQLKCFKVFGMWTARR